MSYKVTTQPSAEPASLSDVKNQLGINDDSTDFILSRRIAGARKWVEDYCGRALISQTIEFRFDEWPDEGVIKVPMPDILSVTSVKYIDGDGVEQTVSSSNYTVDTFDHIIRNNYDYSWPSHRAEKNAIRVVYVAGYGTKKTDVPKNIVDAIINIVGHWTNYQSQIEHGGYLTQVPSAIRRVLDNYRARWFA